MLNFVFLLVWLMTIVAWQSQVRNCKNEYFRGYNDALSEIRIKQGKFAADSLVSEINLKGIILVVYGNYYKVKAGEKDYMVEPYDENYSKLFQIGDSLEFTVWTYQNGFYHAAY